MMGSGLSLFRFKFRISEAQLFTPKYLLVSAVKVQISRFFIKPLLMLSFYIYVFHAMFNLTLYTRMSPLRRHHSLLMITEDKLMPAHF